MRTKAKHTPGPWEISRVPIQSRGGSNTCWRIGPFSACIYDDWRPREAGISEKENEANARLIAAAPELADALEAALSVLEAVNEAHRPGTRIAGFEGALESVLSSCAALRKAGRLP